MRKTAAYFASILFLFYAGLSLLQPIYEALAAWMGPLLGSHIYTILVIFTLFVLDPLRNIPVGMAWLMAGLLIGLISRKKLGSAITAFLVWFTMIPLLFASIFGVYMNIMDRGLTEIDTSEVIKLIPVLPEQLNIESFFKIPIFSDLALQIMEMASSMDESIDPIELIMDIAMQFLAPILLKPVLIIMGAITGAIIGARVLDKLDLKLPTRKTAAAALVMLTVLSQGLTIPQAHGINYDDGLYLEAIGGYIEKEGRAITGQVLIGSEVEVISPGAAALEDLVVSFVITQKIYNPEVLYSLPIPNIEHLVPMTKIMPDTFAVTVYAEKDISIVEARSEQVVSEFEAVYGIEFSKIISNPVSFEENEEGSLPPMTFTLYYSMSTFEETAENINAGFNDMGGFADTISERHDGKNMDIELFVAGLITPEYFQAMLPIEGVPLGFEEPFEAVFGNTFSVLAGVQMIKEGATASGDALDLIDLLGISTPSYAADSDISVIIISRDNYTGTSEGLEPDTKMKLSLPADSSELMILSMVLPMFGMIEIDSGPPSLRDLRIDAPEIIVPDISLEKTVQRDGDQSMYTVTATNNGAIAIENVEIHDSFPTKYGVHTSGTNQVSRSILGPGESLTISYTTTLSSPGVYTEIPALMTWDGEVFSSAMASNILDTRNKAPDAFSLLADTYGAIKAFGDYVFDGRGYMLDVVFIGFVLLIALIDIIRYVKGRSKPEPEIPDEHPLPDPQEFGDIPGDPQ